MISWYVIFDRFYPTDITLWHHLWPQICGLVWTLSFHCTRTSKLNSCQLSWFFKIFPNWNQNWLKFKKLWKLRLFLVKILPKIGQIGILMGHFYIPSGTSLPKPNLSTPGYWANNLWNLHFQYVYHICTLQLSCFYGIECTLQVSR